jgi:sugar phosphate isomerase/epimerase
VELRVFKSTWGMTGPIEAQLEQVAAAAYDGVEVLVPPFPPADPGAQRHAVRASGLEAIPLILTFDGDHDGYRRAVESAASYDPRQITSHTGSDTMSHAEAVELLGFALELEAELGIPIAHETHRQHLFATPWQTAALLRELPALRIAADYSHWVVVAERLLDDRADDVSLANRHAMHVHARVGHPQGPQVNDPRSPANAEAVERFESWWRDIFRQRAVQGAGRVTVTPEYGPPPYMPTIPFTDAPVADLWELCLWGATRVRELFASATDLPRA